MIKLLPDYEIRVRTMMVSYRSRQFVWGKSDCMLFVSDCIEAMTGSDVTYKLRGKYHNAKGAMKALNRHYGTNSFLLGFEEIMIESGFVRKLEELSFCVVEFKGEHIGALYFNGNALAFQDGGFAVFDKDSIVSSWAVDNG